MKLRLSLIKLFKPIGWLSLVLILGLLVIFLTSGGLAKDYVVVFLIPFGVLAIPTIYLFFEYYGETNGRTIIINADELVVIQKSGKVNHIPFSDLAFIKFVKSGNVGYGFWTYIAASPFEFYYHAQIWTINGQVIILTSVMDPDINEALKLLTNVEIEVVRTGFANISI